MSASKPRILLCASGLTPQVITETLYALLREGGTSVPDEVHVLTTRTGAEIVQSRLYGAKSPMAALCDEWDVTGKVRAGMPHVHVLGGNDPLDDIRTTEDNRRASDFVFDLVRRLVANSQSLHVSLAGGRKTMGFLLGAALQLLGREQDELSHVLVAAPFESNPAFFYPSSTVQEYTFRGPGPDQTYTLPDTHAHIELARLPLIRLGDRLDLSRLAPADNFADAVAKARLAVEVPMVTLHLGTRTVRVGQAEVKLTALETAIYHAMLDATLRACPGFDSRGICDRCFTDPRELPLDLILKDMADAYGQLSPRYDAIRRQISTRLDVGGWYRQRRTAINKKLERVPQGRSAQIISRRLYGNSTYGVCLPRNRICILPE